jgi:excinuclease ABC subunit C
MTRADLENVKLPDAPGVYFFRDARKKILYIGKATSLKDRVKSYFAKDLFVTRGPLLVQMLQKAKNITFEKTDSVLEALILETRLIKQYKPAFNTKEKDDKSYNYLVVTKEAYPRVLVVRGKDLEEAFPVEKRLYLLGPFTKGGALKEGMKLIRKIFPFRDKCSPNSGRPCFNAQLGLCPNVCGGIEGSKSYTKSIKQLILFLEGKKKKLITELARDMKVLAKARKFEQAELVKKKLYALSHIQDVTLLKREDADVLKEDVVRIEAYDVAHLSGKEMVGVMVVIENTTSNKGEYRKFKIKGYTNANDPGALNEVLTRRFNHPEWPLPQLIVVDGNSVQKQVAEKLLQERDLHIPVVAVVKDEHHRPRAFLGEEDLIKKHKEGILLGNSEAHRFSITYHKLLRKKAFLPK